MSKAVVNSILAIDLTVTGPKTYQVSGNRIWLAQYFLVRDSTQASGWNVKANNALAVVAIKFDQAGEALPFGGNEGMVNMFAGDFSSLIVEVVTPDLANGHTLYLHTGSDLGIGYGNSGGLEPYIGPAIPAFSRL